MFSYYFNFLLNGYGTCLVPMSLNISFEVSVMILPLICAISQSKRLYCQGLHVSLELAFCTVYLIDPDIVFSSKEISDE